MSSIQDLLPIPIGTEAPNAYDVFGLQSGEQDTDRITKSVLSVIENLKSVKEQSDPELWNQAARMVDHSRQILADPKRKSALDSKLNLVSSSAHSDQSGDPLAGLLPDGDPLAPVSGDTVDGDTDLAKPDSAEMPPGPFGTASQTPTAKQVLVNDQPVLQTAGPTTGRRQRQRQPRRRASATGMWMLGLMILALVGTTGLLTYFVVFGQDPANTASSEKQIAAAAKPSGRVNEIDASDSRRLAQGRQSQAISPDPIMGDLAANVPEERSDTFGDPSGVASGIPMEESESVDSPETPEMIGEPGSSPITPAGPLTPVGSTATGPELPVLSESQQQKELDAVRTLIRESDWAKIKIAADALTEKVLSPDNQADAQGLYELADLASFYRGGIERAVAELDVGNDFEVTDSFRVVVVDKGADLLIVRFNRKNRSFKLDEFPFSLAHKLASFQVPEGPTGQAAKAAYQAIAVKATDAHRDQSIDWLKSIDGEIEGANKDRLIKAIETFYSSANE